MNFSARVFHHHWTVTLDGMHLRGWRCPPGTLAWNKTIVNHNSVWRRYQCHKYQQQYTPRTAVVKTQAQFLEPKRGATPKGAEPRAVGARDAGATTFLVE